MKPMKLTSLAVMLLVAFSTAAQEEFFDDVYFSSSKDKKKEKTEEKVIQPKQQEETKTSSGIVLASASDSNSSAYDENRDVDEYNRRYTSVDVEEPYDEDMDEEDGTYIEELPDNNQKVTNKRNAVPIRNIPNVLFVIIHRVRSRLPVQIRWICI